MTDEQINALAREYAESVYPRNAFIKESDRDRAVLVESLNVKHFLHCLSARYCIVEKSKLTNEYDKCEERLRIAIVNQEEPFPIIRLEDRLSLLRKLFPELFKDE